MEIDTGSEGDKTSSYQRAWIEEQDSLRRKLIVCPDGEDFEWTLSPDDNLASPPRPRHLLRYIGGLDVSFSKDDPNVACGALVVVDLLRGLEVVHETFRLVRLQVPYIPGFLAFREAPILLSLLDDMKKKACSFYPQLLMVDGNGLLHPRGFGLACHLGVLADLPTIGIGKNLHHVDGLTLSGVKQLLEDRENCTKDLITLTGYSGKTWGAAMRSTPGSSKPIFISVGHRMSLDSCIKIIEMCCKFRVPEPIRQADIRSRRYLQNMPGSVEHSTCDEMEEERGGGGGAATMTEVILQVFPQQPPSSLTPSPSLTLHQSSPLPHSLLPPQEYGGDVGQKKSYEQGQATAEQFGQAMAEEEDYGGGFDPSPIMNPGNQGSPIPHVTSSPTSIARPSGSK